MKTSLTKRWTLGVALLTVGIVAIWVGTPVVSKPSQQPQSTRPLVQPAPRQVRRVPSLAVFMVAFESAITGQKGTNPELVNAIEKALAETPEARDIFSELLRAYKALPAQKRIALVGRELASATPATKLSPNLVNASLFRTQTPLDLNRVNTLSNLIKAQPLAAQVMKRSPRSPSNADRGRRTVEQLENLAPGLKLKGKEWEERGAELKEHNSATYRVAWKGIFCSDEGDDWGSSCEPYVIFMMNQGTKVWTKKGGPYSMNSGDKVYKDWSLRKETTLDLPLTITTLVMENDSWDPNKVVSAIQAGASAACYYKGGSDCPKYLKDILEQILDWFFALIGNDDDQVGPAQVHTVTKSYAQSHTGNIVDIGFAKDYEQLFDGNSYRFWLFYDVQQVSK